MKMDIEKDKYGFIEIKSDLINKKIIRDGSKIIFKIGNLVLAEFYTGKSYSYKAVDVINNKVKHLYHSKKQLTEKGYEAVKERMLLLPLAKVDNINTIDREKQIITYIFETVLPKYGFAIRRSQVELAISMHEAIKNRNIALCEAEVGTGKTFSYLIAGIVNGSTGTNHLNLPIVITTSSIALQKAIIEDYIPLISKILREEGIIDKNITAVIRKGKSHYVCDRRLKDCINSIPHKRDTSEFDSIVKLLDVNMRNIDLDQYDDITAYVKSRINVTERCNSKCPEYLYCRYSRFLNYAKSYRNIQICNHNYFFADVKRRSQNKMPIIPEHSMVIIDECHKILDVARQMYGTKIAKNDVDRLINSILKLEFSKKKGWIIKEYAEKLKIKTERVYKELLEGIKSEENEETERFKANITDRLINIIKKMTYNINSLIYNIENDESSRNRQSRYIISALLEMKEKLSAFMLPQKIIYCENKDRSRVSLCSMPKDLHKRLYDNLWRKGLPFILTSGTLSENGSFTHFNNKIGIDLIEKLHSQGRVKVQEVTKSSPFNYWENTLLYINHKMPFPNSKDKEYIKSIANKLIKLIKATYGHTMVLFTSYRTMNLVFKRVSQADLNYPLIKMGKGKNSINAFKSSINGVLFATGAVWEGTDISGDTLSSLIVVKLPFSVPDPISEYEQTQYESFEQYKEKAILPEMIIKLKQGVGRLIRSETDTGVISILDSRMKPKSNYYNRVIKALPKCKTTNSIEDIERFIKDKKHESYFLHHKRQYDK